MRNLFLMMADIMPENMLIEKIKEEASEYLLCPTEEKKRSLIVSCLLLTTKQSVEKEGLMESINRLDEIDRADAMINKKCDN